MSIQSVNDLAAAFDRSQRWEFNKASATSEGAGVFHSLWKVAGFPAAGATPPTGNGAVPTAATLGAFPVASAGGSRVAKMLFASLQGATLGRLTFYDRLWHNSGFVCNSVAAQTIASPPVLTRPDALGAGVELWGEFYTAPGATAGTWSVSYTNQDGTPGQIATYSKPANAETVGQAVRFTLAAGDTGVRTVESLTLDISSGSAGDFGLVLARPLASIGVTQVNVEAIRDAFQLGMPLLEDDVCIAMRVLCSATNTGAINGALIVGEN